MPEVQQAVDVGELVGEHGAGLQELQHQSVPTQTGKHRRSPTKLFISKALLPLGDRLAPLGETRWP